MINSEKIINAILQKFKSMESNDTRDWTGRQWNKAVKTALCRVGRDLGYLVWASHVDDQDKDGGEFLYDVSWLNYASNSLKHEYEDNLLKSWPMVAESEWAKIGNIKEDFEKLLVARAAIRVMVFNGKWHKDGAETIASQICSWVGAYEGSQKGDTYLLMGHEKDKHNWRFRYFKILVDNPDEPPALIRL